MDTTVLLTALMTHLLAMSSLARATEWTVSDRGRSFRMDAVDNVCRHKHGARVLLPWDCSGYIHCAHDRSYWFQCPPGLQFSGVLGLCVWPRHPTACRFRAGGNRGRFSAAAASALKRQESTWSAFCHLVAEGVVADPSNCARYYDCGQESQQESSKECPYPQLFSTATLRCQDFQRVKCGSRYEPREPCEYRSTQQGCKEPWCLPCQERCPSCVGKEDGDQPILGRPHYPYYLRCQHGRTLEVLLCPHGNYFSHVSRTCVPIWEAYGVASP